MKKQTCLKPIYAEHKDGKMNKIIERYEFDFPEFITEDLGFEMQFGFPSPKDLPNKNTAIVEQPWPHNRYMFNHSKYIGI